MVKYEKLVLSNGMKVLLHRDPSTPLVAVNLLFRAGSKYDPPARSGLAHLFEHLMFSGTPDVPDFDTPVQESGGENNAFTNSDYANYYSYGPAANLDTLLWLEADRMHNLNVSQHALSVQQQVVIEELYETCLNLPYGDVWHHVLPLIYRDHPYQWPVIGRDEKEIASIRLEDIADFHKKYYHASNAILSVAGNINIDQTARQIESMFGSLNGQKQQVGTYAFSLEAYKPARLEMRSKVPVEAFYLIFPMPERNHRQFYVLDLLSDLLADGRSSILYQQLVKEHQILTTVDAYITGTLDTGLLIIEGRLAQGVSINEVESRIFNLLEQMEQHPISTRLMEKLKNNVESTIVFSEASTLNKAMNLSFFELIGDSELINTEQAIYRDIGEAEIRQAIGALLSAKKATLFHYLPRA